MLPILGENTRKVKEIPSHQVKVFTEISETSPLVDMDMVDAEQLIISTEERHGDKMRQNATNPKSRALQKNRYDGSDRVVRSVRRYEMTASTDESCFVKKW